MLIETKLRFERRANVGVQGANSVVYLAFDQQLNATLVVKEVEKAKIDATRYFDEASQLYAVRHPNIAEVLYCTTTDDKIYLAMPKYETSVEGILRGRPLTVREIVRIGTDFLTGLHHVHARGFLHFDVKPSNVLVDVSGKALLTDFGLAKPVDVNGLASPEKIYESHIAPEAVGTSTALSAQYDVYQAGLTLYRMCLGTPLWMAQLTAFYARVGGNWRGAVQSGAFPRQDSLPAHIPTRLRNVIFKALATDPAARYSTVLDLLNDLAKVDENLDWQFTPGPAEWSWEWTDATHLRKVLLRAGASGRVDVLASRTNLSTGDSQNLKSVAASGLKLAQAPRSVRQALDELTPAS